MKRGLFLLVGLLGCFEASPEEQALQQRRSESNEVDVICQQLVATTLKSPGSAKFNPGYGTVAATSLQEGVWHVRGVVDAQNTYGGLMRSAYSCELQKLAGDWKLLDIKVQ